MSRNEEHVHQVIFINWARNWLPAELKKLIFAIPNGERTSWWTAKKTKAEGRVSGVPDIFFAWSRLGYHGLFIEMKKPKGGYASPEQREFMALLIKAGYYACVCNGQDEAKEVLTAYMIKSEMPKIEDKYFRWRGKR